MLRDTVWGHWTQRVRTSVSSPRGHCSCLLPHIHTALLSEELATRTHSHAHAHTALIGVHWGAIELCLKTRSTKPEHENASGITLTSLMTLCQRETTTALDGHRSPMWSLYSLIRVGKKNHPKRQLCKECRGSRLRVLIFPWFHSAVKPECGSIFPVRREGSIARPSKEN